MTRWQKSNAEPLTRCGASSGPHDHRLPSGAVRSTRNGSAGGVRPCTVKAKSRVRTPRWAIDFNRAEGGTCTPNASATSRPCAQVSMSRAVAIDGALIGGPNHSSLRPSGTVRNAACNAWRVLRQSASSWVGDSAARSSAASSTNVSIVAVAAATSSPKAASSVIDISATRSVHSRCPT